MTPRQYLKEVTHGVQHLFEGLSYYHNHLRSVRTPIFSCPSSEPNPDQKHQMWLRQNRRKIEAYHKHIKEYFDYSTSKGALSGAILQIAFTGIRLYSKKRTRVPKSCKAIFQGMEKSDVKSYCIGRTVYDLPIGLIIYAARNQYSHMDQRKYRPITERVFEHLTMYGTCGKYRNPQFDLQSRKREIYADNILAILEWTGLEQFMKDMRTMLKCT